MGNGTSVVSQMNATEYDMNEWKAYCASKSHGARVRTQVRASTEGGRRQCKYSWRMNSRACQHCRPAKYQATRRQSEDSVQQPRRKKIKSISAFHRIRILTQPPVLVPSACRAIPPGCGSLFWVL
eukprot:SAG22_NODE_5942_length_927_cov_2.001208_1_plen_124_part_10